MKWTCQVCNQTFEGDEPPVPCPVCGAGEEAFLSDTEIIFSFKCTVCGQVFEGKKAPVPCPVCGAGADAFEKIYTEAVSFSVATDNKYLIVGGGVAGFEAAKAIRERDSSCSIKLICGEDKLPYNRPALSDVVEDNISLAAITLEDASFFVEKNIEIVFDEAVSIYKEEKSVTLKSGERLLYDKLLISTGANAFNPYKKTDEGMEILTLRSFSDAMNFISLAEKHKKVAIIGGGILGIEAAAALHTRGLEVSVIELAPRIISIQGDEVCSARLRADLEAMGMAIYTGAKVSEILQDKIVLEGGEAIKADFVLASIGVRSELAVAFSAGIAVNRGILVNEAMRTSDKHIYAAGDCAEYNERVAGLWAASAAMGGVAGANMVADTAKFTFPIAATSFELHNINLFTAGRYNEPQLKTLTLDKPSKSYRRLHFDGKKLVGAAFYGNCKGVGEIMGLMGSELAVENAVKLL